MYRVSITIWLLFASVASAQIGDYRLESLQSSSSSLHRPKGEARAAATGNSPAPGLAWDDRKIFNSPLTLTETYNELNHWAKATFESPFRPGVFAEAKAFLLLRYGASDRELQTSQIYRILLSPLNDAPATAAESFSTRDEEFSIEGPNPNTDPDKALALYLTYNAMTSIKNSWTVNYEVKIERTRFQEGVTEGTTTPATSPLLKVTFKDGYFFVSKFGGVAAKHDRYGKGQAQIKLKVEDDIRVHDKLVITSSHSLKGSTLPQAAGAPGEPPPPPLVISSSFASVSTGVDLIVPK